MPTPGVAETELLDEDPGFAGTTSVVAVIDTGINPFHEAFRHLEYADPGTLPVEAVDSRTGKAPLYVPIDPISNINDGDWLNDVLEPRTLYRFAGTNLLYYSVLDDVSSYDYHGHGTGTAGTVVQNAPDVVIVAVQTTGSTLFQAIDWAGEQDWIDVVSVSWGCGLDCTTWYPREVLGESDNGFNDHAQITKDVWDSGKLYVNSAGNDPTLHWTDHLDGPRHVISVGGVDPEGRSETRTASKLSDVVSDYIVQTPKEDSVTGYREFRGTSFSAPTVSGTLAQSIFLARQAAGHTGGLLDGKLVDAGGVELTNADFREALNRTADYWGPEDWDPEKDQNALLQIDEVGGEDYPVPYPFTPICFQGGASDNGRLLLPGDGPEQCIDDWDDVLPPLCWPDGPLKKCSVPVGLTVPGGQPVNPVAPWLEMGWGYLNGDHAAAITSGLVDGTWSGEKPLEVHAYMDQRQQARGTLWPHPTPVLQQVCDPPGVPQWCAP